MTMILGIRASIRAWIFIKALPPLSLLLPAGLCRDPRHRGAAPAGGSHRQGAAQCRDLPRSAIPYQIDNIWYYPREQPDYDETGIASWYGPDFYGKYTANGELYDGSQLTAAHRTLPMPVNVRVTNLDNGKSIIVQVG